MNLLDTLNNISKQLKRDINTSINSGGCCVVAAILASHLKNIIPYKIVVLDDGCAHIDRVRAELRNNYDIREWNNNGVTFGHVLVEFEYGNATYWVDSNGVHDSLVDMWYGEILSGSLTLKEATALAESSKGWCTLFNRDYIPQIDHIIEMHFNYYNVMRIAA